MTDEMIVALAKKGGVVQVDFACEFLSRKSANTSSFGNPALAGKRAAAMKDFKGTLDERRATSREVARELGLQTVRATLAGAVAHINLKTADHRCHPRPAAMSTRSPRVVRPHPLGEARSSCGAQ